MQRIRRGFRLVGHSWDILRDQPQLLGVVGILVLAQLAVVGAYASGVVGWHSLAHDGRLGYLRLYPALVVCQMISVLAAAVVTYVVADRLEGGSATWRDGVAATVKRAPALIGWALLTATVGLVLRVVQERLGFIGRIVFGVIGIVWSVATAFAVPVIVLEDAGPIRSVRRSASLIRQRWGEQLTGDTAIGVALLVCAIPLFIAAAFGFAAGPAVGIVLEVAVFALLLAGQQALGGIFQVALYRYAVSGNAPGPYTDDDVMRAYRPRRSRGAGSGQASQGLRAESVSQRYDWGGQAGGNIRM